MLIFLWYITLTKWTYIATYTFDNARNDEFRRSILALIFDGRFNCQNRCLRILVRCLLTDMVLKYASCRHNSNGHSITITHLWILPNFDIFISSEIHSIITLLTAGHLFDRPFCPLTCQILIGVAPLMQHTPGAGHSVRIPWIRLPIADRRYTKYIDGLVPERRNSSALAMELRLSCTNTSIFCAGHNVRIPWRRLPIADRRYTKYIDGLVQKNVME